jgi:hypothetical protein
MAQEDKLQIVQIQKAGAAALLAAGTAPLFFRFFPQDEALCGRP